MKKFKTLQELFRSKKRWVKFHQGEDVTGHYVDPHDTSAIKWCLLSGAFLVYSEDHFSYPENILQKIVQLIPKQFFLDAHKPFTIARFNNDPSTTIKDIQRLVRKAGV